MSENQPGPIHLNPQPGPVTARDIDGEMQTHIADAPFHLSQEPVTSEVAPSGYSNGGAQPAPAYEHLGELPASYGTQSVYLVAYDPRQLFAYWDLDPTEGTGKKYSLHICHPNGEIESKVDILPTEAGRYLAAARPNGTYHVELGTYSRNGVWQPVASSGRVTLPAEGLAGETEPKFATLPFHLSFQRLMELIEGAMGSKENLTAALARLQRGERPAVSSLLGALSHLSGEQIHTLEMILGEKFAMDSEAGIRLIGQGQFFRDKQEVLSSFGHGGEASASGAGASELLSSSETFGSESMSSATLGMSGSEARLAAGGLGSESLTSSALSSEVTLKPLSSETLSSFSGGMGSQTISSFSGGLGNDSLSSWGGLSSETLSSGGFGSESLLSLLAGLSSESLSSFFAAFAGGSETLSSGMHAGPSSEAWRLAGGQSFSGGDLLSSDRATMFLHAVENNLEVLSSLFSHSFSSLDSGSNGNSGSLGGLGGNSESVAKKKSLW